MLGASEIRRLLADAGHDPRKSLGQNFVADPNTVRRIVRLAEVGPGDRVLEIGPGLGSLTLALAEAGADVLAIEKDSTLLPVLGDVLTAASANESVRVLSADAMDADWVELLSDEPWTLVANLPYNVAVPVVIGVLRRAPMVQRLVVMVQREVADRLVAAPGGRTIGIPSIKVGWFAAARMLATVAAEVFVPRPRVASAIVGMKRRPPPSDLVGPDEVFSLVETAYHQRRKMLRSTLGGVLADGAFAASGIAPTDRPEQLSVEQWARLAEANAAVGGHRVKVHVVANAKLTLSLRITGVREDGYHLIDAEMVSLDLADDLVIDPEGDGLDVMWEGQPVPTDRDNLVLTALRTARRRARVELNKRIPAGAGLGGGSSDAAAVLWWAGLEDPTIEDPAVATSVGADVAFCVRGGRARVRGIGEILDPLEHHDEEFTMLVSPVHCSTPVVYRRWDEMGGPSGDHGNDLEPAALSAYPELVRWRDELARSTQLRPRLAGSGSTWFVEGAFPGPGRIVCRTVPARSRS